MAELTPEQVQQIIELSRQLAPQVEPRVDLRRQEGETPESYRARVEAARAAPQRAPTTGEAEVQALAEEGLNIMPAQEFQARRVMEEAPFLTRAGVAAKGIPFAGEWMDNLRARNLGEDQAQILRDATGIFQEENPYESMALQLGTGVASTLPLIPLAAPYVAGGAGATLAGQTVRSGIAGLLGGGLEGAVSGYGEEGDRFANALTRGAVGAGVGLGFGLLAPPVIAGIGNFLRDPVESAATTGLNVSPQASRFLSRVLGQEDPQIARDALSAAGRTGMLADTSPQARGVLDYAMQLPETPSAIGRRISDRATTVMGDMTQAMDDTLGKPQGLISIEEAIRTNAAPNVRAAYDAAYNTPINYAAPEGAAIESILGRLPPKIAMRAVDMANERMRWDPSIARKQFLAQISDDGEIVFDEMPNVMQLDYMKRAFDAIARDGTDPITGRMSSDAAFARDIARQLRDATRDAVPVYGQALELASDQLSQEAAVDFGATLLTRNVTREQVQREVKAATGPELTAMRLALRSNIDEQLANVRRIRSNPGADLDGRKLGAIFDQLNSEAAHTKLKALLGPDAGVVIDQIEAAQQALTLASDTAKNSRTFGRDATQVLADEINQPNLAQALAMGQPIETTQRLIQAATSVNPEGISQQSQRVINEIVDVLTRSGNVQAMQALKLIQQASAARPVTDKQAYQIAQALTAAVSAGGYQQGTQNLTGQLRGLLAQ